MQPATLALPAGPDPAVRCRAAARQGAAAAAAVGGAVMLGWLLDVAALRSVGPGLPEMTFNAALCFVLIGAALWARVVPAGRGTGAARALQAGVLVFALLTLGEYLIGRDLGIDQWLIADRSTGSPHPGRIPLPVALNFVLLALALWALDARSLAGRRAAQVLAALVGAISFVTIIGHAYEVSSLVRPNGSGPFALHGAVAFLLLSAGTLLARPEHGAVADAIRGDAGGRMIRSLLPAALLVPPLLGWLSLEGEYALLYGQALGTALLVTAIVAALSLLIWRSAASTRRFDARHQAAEARASAQLARLGLLAHITRAIGERQDPHSIFQVVVHSLEDHLPIDFGCVLLIDADAGTLTVDAIGRRGAALAAELALGEHARLCIEEHGLVRCLRGVLVHEPDLSSVALPFAQRLCGVGLHALVMAPLNVDGKPIGLLAAARRTPHSFSSGDCGFLLQLGQHVALATRQARLHDALQRAYDELRQSQQLALQQERLRALGQMASGIAHDINNAIVPARLLTEHLQEDEPGLSERGRRSLATVAHAVDDVAATVARLRDFYRPRDDARAPAPTDLNRLVQQVVEMTRARWADMPQQRGIVIQLLTELADTAPNALAVESELREALINLVFNAVDAMPEGGRLTLRTCGTPEGSARLEVADTGSGMDEDTRRRCLEPFFTTKGERGTGLGLAMVYGTAQRHGATLEIQSAPGRGTTMALAFPRCARNADPAPAPAAPPARPARPARMRILLVDDDPMVLATLKAMLEIDGHQVVEADSGQAGIDLFKDELGRGEGISVVLTDLGMPSVDGRQVASAVKALSPATPVVMLTGWGAQGLDGNRDHIEHVDVVLGKPPKRQDLRQTLARYQ